MLPLRTLSLTLLLCTAAAQGATPLWLRQPALSPDGSRLLFTWQGRLFIAPSAGGTATPLTGSDYLSHSPVWSPDGEQIAFSADLYGNDDVYVMPVAGGPMTRLTFDSRPDRPLTFSADGREVVLTSQRPGLPEQDFYALDGGFGALYRAPVGGGALIADLPLPAQQARYRGQDLLYQMPGTDQVWRKHQHSFAVPRVWLQQDGRQRQLSEDRIAASDPWWSPDGKGIVYLSERSGDFNVWRHDLASGKEQQLTHYRGHPVRQLTMADNGDLAWSWQGELYRLPTGATEPQRLSFTMLAALPPLRHTFPLTRPDQAVVSPEGEEAILVAGGDLFAVDLIKGSSRPLTRTPSEESAPLYLPEQSAILFLSERHGAAALYRLEPADPERPLSAPGALHEEEVLRLSGQAISQPTLSRDGKRVAFVVDGQAVWLLELESGKKRALLGPEANPFRHSISLAFSPSGQQLAVTLQPDSAQQEVAVLDLTTPDAKPVNVSQNGYLDELPAWSEEGGILYWQSARYGLLDADGEPVSRTLLGLYSSRSARADALAEREPPKQGYPFDSQHLGHREALLHPLSGTLLASQLRGGVLRYITEEYLDGPDPVIRGYALDIASGERHPLFEDQPGPALASLDREGAHAILIGDGTLTRIPLDSGESEQVSFTLQQEQEWQSLMTASFDQIARLTRSEFYDPDMNGVKWDDYVRDYRRFLPSIGNPTDFATLLGELAGELNVSHTWGISPAPAGGDESASLGAVWREQKQGLLLAALLPGGPLEMESEAAVGDRLLAIDGEAIESLPALDRALNHRAGQRLQLTLQRGKHTIQAEVMAMDLAQEAELTLTQWRERRRAYVEQQSQGRIGYVYVPEMNAAVYADVVAQVLGRERSRQALIVDVRFNKGGYLANTLVEFLSGNGEQQGMASSWPRAGKGAPDSATRQWTKPSLVLANAASYSEGSAFPRYYQALKLGPVVGEPIPGTGTTVYNHSSRLIPGLEYGIPTLALRAPDGTLYENREQEPDKLVRYTPADLLAGRDPQLDAAIEEALTLLKGRPTP
ncbi:S41 family peptidase [Aeromonas diversa]|uniref:S41 family peptidase n=1 Tax=Aeromonas diversa TaxID=502790 RepID=UPI0034620B93